jgi:hypothetical protein
MISKRSGRLAGFAAGVMLSLCPLAATGASASTGATAPTPVNGGYVKLSPNVAIPQTTVNVGGGTWNYGVSVDWTGTKHCWSHYVHPTRVHSATTVIGSQNRKVYNGPGAWANSDSYDALWNTCYAYWNTY